MKIFQITLGVALFISTFTIWTNAQNKEALETKKIAVIDTNLFEDETKGIKLLFQKKITSESSENFYLFGLIDRVTNLEKEIDELLIKKVSINEKYIELLKLKAEFKEAKERDEESNRKRYSLMVAPINQRIQQKINEFIKLKGYSVVFQKDGILELSDIEVTDITSEFIRFCNESFEKEALK